MKTRRVIQAAPDIRRLPGPGTVGVPVGELARFHQFTFALASLQKPPDTRFVWCQGSSINANLNTMVSVMRGDWFWRLDDDHLFSPDTLMRLLARFDDDNVDIVVPLVSTKRPPFRYVIFHEYDHKTGEHRVIHPDTLPQEGGLVEVAAAGGAGMLIRRRVFDAMNEQPFRNMTAHKQDEDVTFCLQARKAGFRIWCDLDVQMGHLMTAPITPRFQNGAWGFEIEYGPADKLFLQYTEDD